MNKPRIVLAEDHTMVAEGIGKLLRKNYRLVKIVTNGKSLLETVKKDPPDLILVDISLPLLNGIEATRQIKKIFPSIKIVILTMYADSHLVKEAIAAGISGYLLKESAASELLCALKEVSKGHTYFSHSVTEKVGESEMTSHGKPPNHPDMPLTPRQREILQLIAEGRSNKEISSVLNRSIKTVEFHKSRMMRALGLHSIPELTQYAIENRIISLSR